MNTRILLVLLVLGQPARAQITRYAVTLTPDFKKHILRGEERIDFQHAAGSMEWQKQPGMVIRKAKIAGAAITTLDPSVRMQLSAGGNHVFRASYTAAEGRGIQWFPASPGFATAFYCEAWMLCDNTPGQRAVMRLEIILPVSSGLRPAGPGQLTREWTDPRGKHFLFEQNEPVQTYLFSFAVAPLTVSTQERFTILGTAKSHAAAFRATDAAYRFMRSKAGVDPIDARYTQAFLPGPSIGQEAAGLALIADDGDIWLMAHELAHQWWGALVGIRSWSDFWLNEGVASFMAAAFLEQQQGRAAYDAKIAEALKDMAKLRADGKDRPLHWDHWKDAHQALGPIPYVKGLLVLDRLRTTLGEAAFWRGMALYTSRYAHQLVDSNDFQHAMEQAGGRDLHAFFDEAVYR